MVEAETLPRGRDEGKQSAGMVDFVKDAYISRPSDNNFYISVVS
jgi:hypothetical protein